MNLTKCVLAAVALAAAFIMSAATPTASTSCDWRYDIWCIPDRPKLSKPSWPDPRPPLAARNTAWCTRQFIYGGKFEGVPWGWYLTNSFQVKKTMWPDYRRRQYALIYWNGKAWLQPDSPTHEYVNCHL